MNLSSDNLSKAANVTIKSDVGVFNVEADRVSGSKILFAPEAFVVGDGSGTPGSVTLTFEAGPIQWQFRPRIR